MGLTYYATPADSAAEGHSFNLHWSSFDPICALGKGVAVDLVDFTHRCLTSPVEAHGDDQVDALADALHEAIAGSDDTDSTVLRARYLADFLRNAITARSTITAAD